MYIYDSIINMNLINNSLISWINFISIFKLLNSLLICISFKNSCIFFQPSYFLYFFI